MTFKTNDVVHAPARMSRPGWIVVPACHDCVQVLLMHSPVPTKTILTRCQTLRITILMLADVHYMNNVHRRHLCIRDLPYANVLEACLSCCQVCLQGTSVMISNNAK